MKVAVISDIHIDEQDDELELEKTLAECTDECQADYLLIGGDISEYYLRTLAFVRRLGKRTGAKIYYCPGNHDLWSKHEPETRVSEILEYMGGPDGDEGFLQNKAVKLTDKTVLIGGCGWYDYSFAHAGKFSKEHLSQKHYMGRYWKDGLYAKHDLGDEEVDRAWNKELEKLLIKYQDHSIIFMTHMVNQPEFLVGRDHPKYEMFKYFNGFLGSNGLYELTKYKNVKYSISGHVHYRKSVCEDGVYYMCRCLGYPTEFPAFGGKQGLKDQILSAMEVIDIQ